MWLSYTGRQMIDSLMDTVLINTLSVPDVKIRKGLWLDSDSGVYNEKEWIIFDP